MTLVGVAHDDTITAALHEARSLKDHLRVVEESRNKIYGTEGERHRALAGNGSSSVACWPLNIEIAAGPPCGNHSGSHSHGQVFQDFVGCRWGSAGCLETLKWNDCTGSLREQTAIMWSHFPWPSRKSRTSSNINACDSLLVDNAWPYCKLQKTQVFQWRQ